jgi:hypothetical protein
MSNQKDIKWEVNENGCWICTSHKPDKAGYARLFARCGEERLMHRIMYEKYKGKIENGLFVLHKCDNPICINPEHLFLGTHQDNMDDMNNKGRHMSLKGESHPRAKLTEEQVKEIRLITHIGCRKIAKIYGIDHTTVCYIRKGKLWKHIKEESK